MYFAGRNHILLVATWVAAAVVPDGACKQRVLGAITMKASQHTISSTAGLLGSADNVGDGSLRRDASSEAFRGTAFVMAKPTTFPVSAPPPASHNDMVDLTTLISSGNFRSVQTGPSASSGIPPPSPRTTSILSTKFATDLPPTHGTNQQPVASTSSSAASGLTSRLPSKAYSGPEAAFPAANNWLGFDGLWSLNEGACDAPTNAGKGQLIKQDVQQVASESGVDPRVILAVILQESTCELNVPTTNGGVRNPGLMQSFNGASYDGTDASILQMIRDGVEGTNQTGGSGIQQYIRQYGLYTGLRAYSSGPNGIDVSNLDALPAGTGTASYCSDIANRLTGALVA